MTRKSLTFLAGAALALGSASALANENRPAGAAEGGKPDGIACQQAGISTLQALGLLSAVAKDGIDVVGVGTLDLKTVLKLHRTMPELFADESPVAVTLDVPGVGLVTADWC